METLRRLWTEKLQPYVEPYWERFKKWQQENPGWSFALKVCFTILLAGLIVFASANVLSGLGTGCNRPYVPPTNGNDDDVVIPPGNGNDVVIPPDNGDDDDDVVIPPDNGNDNDVGNNATPPDIVIPDDAGWVSPVVNVAEEVP